MSDVIDSEKLEWNIEEKKMEVESRNMGSFSLSPGLLEKVLNFPEGYQIVGLEESKGLKNGEGILYRRRCDEAASDGRVFKKIVWRRAIESGGER